MNDHHAKYYEILMNLTRVMVLFSSLKLWKNTFFAVICLYFEKMKHF